MDDHNQYRSPRRPMRQVELLTEGESLLMEGEAADHLESLLSRAIENNNYAEDIHRFSLCFQRATGAVFTMPGQGWVRLFNQRLRAPLKDTGITLVEGEHGAPSQWEREVMLPRLKDRGGKRRG